MHYHIYRRTSSSIGCVHQLQISEDLIFNRSMITKEALLYYSRYSSIKSLKLIAHRTHECQFLKSAIFISTEEDAQQSQAAGHEENTHTMESAAGRDLLAITEADQLGCAVFPQSFSCRATLPSVNPHHPYILFRGKREEGSAPEVVPSSRAAAKATEFLVRKDGLERQGYLREGRRRCPRKK